MKAQSINYLIIVIINLVILTLLLALWTDKLELTFNELVRPIEFLKIWGTTAMSFIGVQLFLFYTRKKNITSAKFKMSYAIVLTLIVSSYLYVNYAQKIIHNVAINGALRESIAEKIKPATGLAYGTMARNLSINEYKELANITQFPPLANQATNIEYVYQYDGFLPDYTFSLKYELPRNTKIDTFSFTERDFSRIQTFKLLRNKIQVIYTEEQF